MRTTALRSLLALTAATGMLAGGLSYATTGPAAAAGPTTTTGCISSVPEKGTTAAVPICWSLFKPAGASATRKVPMVFSSHGWGGSRTTDAAAFSRYLSDGFGVLSFDQRGFGESGGKARVENPAYEGQDVLKLVDMVSRLAWVQLDGPGDPRLGAIGGSYGGGYQFLGAFQELAVKGKPVFDALAPEITWYDLKESLGPSEVARTEWVAALQALGAVDEAPELLAGMGVAVATGTWPKGPEPAVPDFDAFFKRNGSKWHVSQGRRLDIPVLFGQGITDNLFNLNQGLSNWSRALTPAARSKSIFVGYNGGHTLPAAVPAGYGVAGDPCSKRLAGGDFATLAHRFFQEKLKGRQTGLTGYGRLHLATADGACRTRSSTAVNAQVPVGTVTTPTVAGPPTVVPVAAGPLTVSGVPYVTAKVSSVGLDNRSFLALAVGTSASDAKVVQNNTMPFRAPFALSGAARTIELPGIAVHVPKGKKLFLLASPTSDMFVTHTSRTPGVLTLTDTVVKLPQLTRP